MTRPPRSCSPPTWNPSRPTRGRLRPGRAAACGAAAKSPPLQRHLQRRRRLRVVRGDRISGPHGPIPVVCVVTHPRWQAHKVGIAPRRGDQARHAAAARVADLPGPCTCRPATPPRLVEASVLLWLRADLGLPPFLSPDEGDGWTQTIDADAVGAYPTCGGRSPRRSTPSTTPADAAAAEWRRAPLHPLAAARPSTRPRRGCSGRCSCRMGAQKARAQGERPPPGVGNGL